MTLEDRIEVKYEEDKKGRTYIVEPDGNHWYPKRPRSVVLPEYCRYLIAGGTLPDTVITVLREETVCFVPMPVDWWAGKAISEGETSAKYVDYKGFDYESNSD